MFIEKSPMYDIYLLKTGRKKGACGYLPGEMVVIEHGKLAAYDCRPVRSIRFYNDAFFIQIAPYKTVLQAAEELTKVMSLTAFSSDIECLVTNLNNAIEREKMNDES